MSLVFVEHDKGALHIWIGPLGVHIFWPDLWKSRPDYCPNWANRE